MPVNTQIRRRIECAVFCALLALNALTAYELFRHSEPRLRVSVLDIGQGDSILVEGPAGVQMLVDGGPDRSVLRQLPKLMRLFDRSIDLVVETHPDKDHIAGLTDVFSRYHISYFMSPGIPDGTATAKGLGKAVANEPHARAFTARRGMRIHLGGETYADVLYPDRDVSHGPTNEGSIIMHVVYRETSFMLTGDAPMDVEGHVLALDANDGKLPTTVLKAGHHGSKYSTSDAWLAALAPKIVAISAGKGNSYGHPNPETLARIKKEGARILSTLELGTLRFISDGSTVTLE